MKNKALSKTKEIKAISNNSQGINIENLLAQALEKKTPIETVERILEMRRQLKAEWAKEQFNIAMASFQADCPSIKKTKEVKTNTGKIAYKFAPIESVIEQVKPLLLKYGFSYSSNMELLKDNGITIIKSTLKAIHRAGHSEETSMTVPLGGKTNVMSDTQVVAAAQTFAKRYAFLNAFGIMTADEDNETVLKEKDGQPGTEEVLVLPKEWVKAINDCEDYDELLSYCKRMRDQYPKYYPLLTVEYTRRKNEINDEISQAIDEQSGKEN